MTLHSLLILLIIGAIAGWLAGVLVKGFGFAWSATLLWVLLARLSAGLFLACWDWPPPGSSVKLLPR